MDSRGDMFLGTPASEGTIPRKYVNIGSRSTGPAYTCRGSG